MKLTTLNIAFLVYVATCAVVSVLCVLLIFFDRGDRTVYASIVSYVLGQFTHMLISRDGKSRTKQVRKALAAARSGLGSAHAEANAAGVPLGV